MNYKKWLGSAVVATTVVLIFLIYNRSYPVDSKAPGKLLQQNRAELTRNGNTGSIIDGKPVTKSDHEPMPTSLSQYPQTAQVALSELSGLSQEYSGARLFQEQTTYLSNLLAFGGLDKNELMILMKEIHYSVADGMLPSFWSKILMVALSRPNFEIRDLVVDLPLGKIGEDMLMCASNAYTTTGIRMNREDFQFVKSNVSESAYRSFLIGYASNLSENDDSSSLKFVEDHITELNGGDLSKIIASSKRSVYYESFSGSPALMDGDLDADSKKILTRSIAVEWVSVDAVKASTWVDSIEDPSLKSATSEALIDRWSRYDLNGAAKWLSSADLSNLDSSVEVLVDRLARYSPDDAIQWANAIKDESLKARMLNKIRK